MIREKCRELLVAERKYNKACATPMRAMPAKYRNPSRILGCISGLAGVVGVFYLLTLIGKSLPGLAEMGTFVLLIVGGVLVYRLPKEVRTFTDDLRMGNDIAAYNKSLESLRSLYKADVERLREEVLKLRQQMPELNGRELFLDHMDVKPVLEEPKIEMMNRMGEVCLHLKEDKLRIEGFTESKCCLVREILDLIDPEKVMLLGFDHDYLRQHMDSKCFVSSIYHVASEQHAQFYIEKSPLEKVLADRVLFDMSRHTNGIDAFLADGLEGFPKNTSVVADHRLERQLEVSEKRVRKVFDRKKRVEFGDREAYSEIIHIERYAYVIMLGKRFCGFVIPKIACPRLSVGYNFDWTLNYNSREGSHVYFGTVEGLNVASPKTKDRLQRIVWYVGERMLPYMPVQDPLAEKPADMSWELWRYWLQITAGIGEENNQ